MLKRVLILVLVLFVGCYVSPPEAIQHTKDQIAVSEGDAADESLPAEARMIGRGNADQWHVHLNLQDGTPIPPGVQARIDQHRRAREAATTVRDGGD